MSKWLRKDDYDMFAGQKQKEAEAPSTDENSFYKKWKNPTMGTVDKAKEYAIRLLPDKVKGYYKKYFYHGFMVGDKFKYILCEKSDVLGGMDNYCPWCDANKILYQGNDEDKKKARDYKRNERFVSNVCIIDDPRDAEVKDEQYKVNGTVRLYEFPATVESKIANEVTDTKNGYGIEIFDPENGYDLILKIKAKPKDDKGKEWPDYGDTMFARKTSPIANSEDKIAALMDQVYSLDEYILSMRKSVEEQEQLLKGEMLWDDVGPKFLKHMKKEGSTTTETKVTQKEEPKKDEPKKETPKSNEVEDTDSLLDELDNM